MLKSVPTDILLVIVITCALKWLISPLFGQKVMFALAAFVALGWVFLASKRHRILHRFCTALPRFRREAGSP